MAKNHYKFIIPIRPDSINDVMSFSAKANELRSLKYKWEQISRLHIRRAIDEGIIPERFKGSAGFFFKLYFEMDRLRDEDNYFLMVKGITDAFVKLGVLEDDNTRFMNWNGIRIRIDKDSPRVEVYIDEEIPDDQIAEIKQYGKSITNYNSEPGSISIKREFFTKRT